ncbi:MAG TPA: methyltransferase domain-containing protein [Anaerolineae bacterium]|nr:methyltransferase domain-containing protein [Anaerolineae bacterium]
MKRTLIRLMGWPAIALPRDPTVFDRWLWLRSYLLQGPYRTLDAGCGAGEFTLYAAKVGNHAIGLSFDVHLNNIARARADLLRISNAEFITADLRALDRLTDELGTFDQIICFETIEHIMNDRKVITDLSQLLNSGGQLLLTAPFKNHRRLPGEKVSESEDGGHVRWGYTHEEIRSIFQSAGLRVQAETYISGYLSQQNLRLTYRLGNTRSAGAILFPLRFLQPLDHLMTRLLNYPYLSIAVIGIRNG